ncbi:hypothetical protein BH24ACT7_BH24ACT7_20880 [soil metagenome]
MDDRVTLAEVAATARRVADAINADLSRHDEWLAMAAGLTSAVESVAELDPPEALLDLRSALVMSRPAWTAIDPGLAADAARVLAGAKRLVIEL